ncbi:hypothetical protein IAT40_006987 [Kwoniella sp. CBS 6097]
MIVCSLCGSSIIDLQSRCSKCSGKAIERITPIRKLLSASNSRNSPDRWADRYTMPNHVMFSSSSLVRSSSSQPGSSSSATPSRPQLARTETFDVALTPSSDAELARDTATVFQGDTMCRSCFTSLFAIGSCHTCNFPIIGDKDEGLGGRHVSSRARKWHAKCFRCSTCGKLPSKHSVPMILPDETPSCEECYHLGDRSIENLTHKQEQPVEPAPTYKYARPGQVFDSSKDAEARAAEVAAELKGLTEAASEKQLKDAFRYPDNLPPSRTSVHDISMPTRDRHGAEDEKTNTDSSAVRQNPPGGALPSRPNLPTKQLSVLERVRLLNSNNPIEQPSNSFASRRPLGLLKFANSDQ